MAKTIADAQEKYRRKTGTTGVSNYNAAKGRAKQNYREGVSAFIGRPVAGSVAAAYDAGIDAANYRGGDADKWARNYIAKMTGS
jgi:hypothetical protein